jgi:hypothetical protein
MQRAWIGCLLLAGCAAATPSGEGALANLDSSYQVGPAKPAEKVGDIWLQRMACAGAPVATMNSRHPEGDALREARAYGFATGDIRVAFPQLPYFDDLDVRIEQGETPGGEREEYLSFSDQPLAPPYAAIVRTELPASLHGDAAAIHSAILRKVEQMVRDIRRDQLAVRDVSGAWGPLVEVLVYDRVGTPCFPTSRIRQIPPGMGGGAHTVGVSRYLPRKDVVIEMALIVRIPPDLPTTRHGEYARARMDEFMGSITVSPEP